MLCVNELFLVLFTVSIDGPNRARGGTSHHRVIRHIVGHHRPSADDTVPTYGHPGHDHRIHSDMAVIANRHAPKPVDVRKLRVKVSKHPDASIMGGDFHTARKTHVVANGDKVGLGAKVIAIENLAPPPMVRPRDLSSSSFFSSDLRCQANDASRDIQTTLNSAQRVTCTSATQNNGNVGSDSACMGKTQPKLIFFGRQEAN